MRRRLFNRRIIWMLVVLYGATSVRVEAQEDSLAKRQRLGPMRVVTRSQQAPSTTLSQTPTQVVTAEKIERIGALVLSDAVKQMAGVTLRDYGGVGGVKTVSIRGLGSQFSTLTVDGVPVSDAQNGQVDLGRYAVGNSAYISLSSGNEESLMAAARALAAVSTITMETQRPSFMPGERVHAGVGFEMGSFGLLSPTLSWQQRINRRLSLTAWGNYVRSNGNYPFRLYYTSSQQDSSSIEKREHSEMSMITGDVNLFYDIDHRRMLTAKVHYVQGFHNLPGPVIYYAKRGSEDTEESLFFAQVKYQTWHEKWQGQIMGKYQRSRDLYENWNANTLTHYLANEYTQQEGYFSTSGLWRATKRLNFSTAQDVAVTQLESNLTVNNEVTRMSWISGYTGQYKTNRMTVKGTLLGTVIRDDVLGRDSLVKYQRLSPYVGISLKPMSTKGWRLRYFYKETYRVPNFNELYYFSIPRHLNPERARQHNVGVTIPLSEWKKNDTTSSGVYYMLTVDGYVNKVRDKIVAVPTQNMFLWSMENVGVVDIRGLDVVGNCEWKVGEMQLQGSVNYSYQHAVDHTDREKKTYGHQIAYTPRHAGGLSLYWIRDWLEVGYNLRMVGERYYKQQNTDETRLPRYADHGIVVSVELRLRIGTLRLQMQVLNLLDKQYEVVRSYPMMGRNYRLKLSYHF